MRLEFREPPDDEFTASATLLGVRVDLEQLEGLLSAASRWLAQPLEGLRGEGFVYDTDLAADSAECLRLVFGPRPDVLAGGGVACAIELRRGSWSARQVLRTDVTCLDELVKGIRAVMNSWT